MSNRRNYYRILHVQPDAPVEVIKSSFRTLMTKLKKHPDLGGEHEGATLINEAYSVLSDPVKRKSYDESLLKIYSMPSLSGGPFYARQTQSGHGPTSDGYTPLIQDYCRFCKTPHGYEGDIHPETRCVECNSPLAGMVRMEMESACQRAVPRVAKQFHLSFFTDWPQTRPLFGVVQDLSTNGIQFLTKENLDTDKLLKVESDIFEGIARIAYARLTRHNAGHVHSIGAEFETVLFQEKRGSFFSERI